jgi:putative transposase
MGFIFIINLYYKIEIEEMNKYNPNIHHRRSIRLKGYDYSKEGLYFITICCQNRIHRFGHVENGEMILNENGKVAYNEWIKLSERFPNMEMDVFQIMPNHIHTIISLIPVRAGFTPAPSPNLTPAPNPNSIPNLTPALNPNSTPNPNSIPNLTPALNPNSTPNPNSIPYLTPAPNDEDILQNDGTIQYYRDTPNLTPSPKDGETLATERTSPSVPDIVGAYKSLVANGCLDLYKSKNKTMGKLWQRNYYEHIIRDEQSYQRISKYIIDNPKKWNEDKFYSK